MVYKVKGNKKAYKKIVWGIIGVLFFTLFYIPKNEVKAEERISGNFNEIKILEIEPGNQFILGNNNELDKIGDCDSVKIKDKDLKVTHVTMAQFISMVDEINGKYDIVIIGRKNNGLKSEYNPNSQYRDYTNPCSQKMDAVRYTITGNAPDNKNPKTIGDKTYVEYYSENDITKKRANEILEMIKSNQLVYMDNNIFTASNDKKIDSTNLYKIFNKNLSQNGSLKQYQNFRNFDIVNISLNDIVNEYNKLPNELKRPTVTSIIKPNDDRNLEQASSRNRNMNFTVNIDSAVEEKLNLNIYLDINADGLFKEKELYKSQEVNVKSGTNSFNVISNLDKNFVGHLDWKVEAIRNNGVKTNVISNSQFKPLKGKRKMRVLQIHPLTQSDGENLYLNPIDNNQADNGAKQLKQRFQKLLADVSDYGFSIDCISYNKFNMDVESGALKLNGSYDMVIIGFADNYGNRNEFTAKAINELDSFIRTGQSVMFTHDTMSINSIDGLNLDKGPK